MILEAVSGYLFDHNVVNVYVKEYIAIDVGSRSDSVLIVCYGDVVAVSRPRLDLLMFCVSDPGMLGDVLGAVRDFLEGCDDS